MVRDYARVHVRLILQHSREQSKTTTACTGTESQFSGTFISRPMPSSPIRQTPSQVVIGTTSARLPALPTRCECLFGNREVEGRTERPCPLCRSLATSTFAKHLMKQSKEWSHLVNCRKSYARILRSQEPDSIYTICGCSSSWQPRYQSGEPCPS